MTKNEKKLKKERRGKKNEEVKDVETFTCKICNYSCNHRGNYNKHLLSRKHLLLHADKKKQKNVKMSANKFVCDCGKMYKHRQM